MRARNESRPPTSAQRGSNEAPTLVPEASYGYWLAVMSTPCARAARMRAITVSLWPQTSVPSALMCEM